MAVGRPKFVVGKDEKTQISIDIEKGLLSWIDEVKNNRSRDDIVMLAFKKARMYENKKIDYDAIENGSKIRRRKTPAKKAERGRGDNFQKNAGMD